MTIPSAPVPQPRNILLISFDDAFAFWRFRDAFGVALQTPNLDRICAVSTAFHAAFCQVPVCGPSRASFLSGRAPHQTGIFDNYTEIFDRLRPEQMWSYRLKQAGFYCASAGKIHHGYRPRPPEIHDPLYSHPAHPCRFGPRPSAPAQNFGGRGNGHGTTKPRDDTRYYDHFSSQDAIDFLQSYAGAAPFYREVGFHNPHPPFKTPARFKEMYDPDAFVMPPSWREGRAGNPFADLSMPANMDLSNDTDWRLAVRNYFSAYSHADWHIGRVWDALQDSPHRDSTVVIIAADHGYHMGDKGRFRKFTLWEEAAGVPLIVHDPARPQARVVEDPVALLDVGPTVLDYAGLAPLEDTPGRSLRPLVEGGQAPERAVPTFWFGSAAIRQGHWRYILYQDGSDQLFDLDQDPWQLHDRAQNHPERARLRAALIDTARAYGLEIRPEPSTDRPALFVAPIEGVPGPAHPPTLGQISFEPPDPALPELPGYRRLFLRPREDLELELPRAYRGLYFAGDGADDGQGARVLNVHCNDLGNHVNLVGGHRRFALSVFGGRGDDLIEVSHEPFSAWLQSGNNLVRAGFASTTIHAGSGRDVIFCQRGENRIFGGAGDCEIEGGIGRDEITTGAGQNHIRCGPGHSQITIAAGSATIALHPAGTAALIYRRTGLPQCLEGVGARLDAAEAASGSDAGANAGADSAAKAPAPLSLDLSDWGPASALEILSEGADTILSLGSERLRLRNCNSAQAAAVLGRD